MRVPHHPSPTARPRPVTLNVWEAVYFDHNLDRLVALAAVGEEVGVERFVLDDGWFRHRRDDTAGLGDWYVDEGLWPDGLEPLITAVRGHGMEFGLWFEPEMVNPDSDLARAHPDWLLGASSGLPVDLRQQQVLDVGQPAVYDYLLERLDSILTEYDIGYVKWDHNRQLIAASTVGGRAGIHRQTQAVYAPPRRAAAPPPRRRDRELLRRRRSHRPRHPRAHRPGLDQRLQRRAGAAVDPALDGVAPAARADGRPRRSDPFAHDRPHA